ncbi:YobI family P-loop NTPase [Marisediminicola antarctica]|uniref:YobI-like P-loop NTPase domain-containing protein n=1 Tax=Marisediminicola antarctica TaxID=674079 RepID=A0A7L5AGN3_9MICO|nr:hypothetical protein [Marisediminicola antarctica]QHO69156.1 hypothetical protein BHD05_05315 [Marisediminicola antarctica]
MAEAASEADEVAEEPGLESATHSTTEKAAESFKIHSLRPEFNAENHELYVGYLRDELSKPAVKSKEPHADDEKELRPRNVALTGSYGSGKSSILSKVVEELGSRVVSVSLSTLGSEETPPEDDSASKDPLKTPAITNAIQKEIVKQLLYREKPSNVPGSRYRRIESFRKGRAFGFSLLIAAGLTALAFLTGAPSRIEEIFGNELGPNVLIYLCVFVLVLILSHGLQSLFHNRVWIERLTSGPASISLTNKSESFFDKYLDEIVYFFEANAYDVVVFEDLDRFNDPYIFETLRELNTLLNNSKQIDPKVITFVYAIKDSIFEQLGKLSINGVKLTDEEIRQLAVTNRTKFFDVVIPVVPFISHRNARDLVSNEMASSGFTFDKAILDLVSKHMVDMRLIKNVHNEFGIFKQKILGAGHLDELKPQPLFAMIVYKNLNMADFEKIKEGTSKLDHLYTDFRELVNEQISSVNRTIRAARTKIREIDSVAARSKELGDRLERYVGRLLGAAGQTMETSTLTLAVATTPEELRGAEFWRTWLNDDALTLTVGYQTSVPTNYYGPQSVSQSFILDLEHVREALGDPLTLDGWESDDKSGLQTSIEEHTDLRDFLKTATMSQLGQRPELVLKNEHGTESFGAMAERHLGKGLALDLVKAGYIDRNFSLYVSMYYDDLVTARARNYILHSVEANAVDINAEIGTGPQIDAMLDEVGDTIFAERSIYNIQLLDHLLVKEDARLDRSMRLIAGDGADESAIRTAYFSSGSQVEALVARLAPLWSSIFNFLLKDESVADEQRVGLIDTALSAIIDKISYKTDAALSGFMRSHFSELATLSGAKPVASIDAIVTLLTKANVRFEKLHALSNQLKSGAVEHSLYDLTNENLIAALDGEENLALDRIGSINDDVFRYVAQDLTMYLEIQMNSEVTENTIEDHKNFISVLNELADNEPGDVTAVVERASRVIVNKITALNEKLWPIVAQTEHLKASYANLTEYIAKRGGIDSELAGTLNASTEIVDLQAADEPGKRTLALAIVASDSIGNEKRAELAKSLGLASPLLVSELSLADEDPSLTAALLASDLIEDSAASFYALDAATWPVKRAFIRRSAAFATYVDEIGFSKPDFVSLAQDPETSEEIKKAVVLNLYAFTDSLSRPALDALAQFVIDCGIAVGLANLVAMATAGVTSTSLVRLISLEIDSLELDDLLSVLRLMPDRYQRLTTTGGHTKIPNTIEDLRLADHLVAAGQVSTRDSSPTGNVFKVNLKRGA